jgi:hypothetical protein
MEKRVFVVFLAVGLSISVATHAVAQGGNIRIGKLGIFPGISVQGVHNDNIYLSTGTAAHPAVSDWITHIMPDVRLNYPFPERGSCSLGYQGDFAYYEEFEDNDWQRHRALFALNYNAPGGVILAVSNTYTDTDDPYGSDAGYKTGVPKTKRWYDDLKATLGYHFSNRFKVLGHYNYFKQEYDLEKDADQNYVANELGTSLQMRLLPKSWGFMRWHYGERDYFTHPPGTGATEENDADFVWQRINTGLAWDIGAKLAGELNFGYIWIDYKNEFDASTTPKRYEDKGTWIAATALSFRATATTTLGLNITRAPKSVGARSRELFMYTSAGIRIDKILIHRISLTVGASYAKSDYNIPKDSPREDDEYHGNIGLNYRIKHWLRAGVDYIYRKRDSNYTDNEYVNNKFIISLGARF